ncbi:MAG: hypothetical protein HC840_08045 [Leptolyngbyaceae cyanobacterium RM2_2_4]|nr:hypothetical protein [Leptolyngbyaceae cyanobacterium RM2_2_4]
MNFRTIKPSGWSDIQKIPSGWSDVKLTTPMHADRREFSVMAQRLSAAGDGQR